MMILDQVDTTYLEFLRTGAMIAPVFYDILTSWTQSFKAFNMRRLVSCGIYLEMGPSGHLCKSIGEELKQGSCLKLYIYIYNNIPFNK